MNISCHIPIITDDHINEAIKLENLIPRAAKMIPKGEFEVKIATDDFIGYIDLLAPVTMFHEFRSSKSI